MERSIGHHGVSESPAARVDRAHERSPGQSRGSSLAALAGMPISSRFCSWIGLSGRRYVFSVYPASECPAFRDAVLLAVVRDMTGQRRVVSVRETGAFRNRWSPRLSASSAPSAPASSSISICWPRRRGTGGDRRRSGDRPGLTARGPLHGLALSFALSHSRSGSRTPISRR